MSPPVLPPLKPLLALPSLPPLAPPAKLTTAQLEERIPRYLPGSHPSLSTDQLLTMCRGVCNVYGEYQAWAYRGEGFAPIRSTAREACIAALEGHRK